MDGFSVGAVRVQRIEEWQGEFTPPEYLFDRFDASAFDAHHRPDWNSVYCEDPDQAARTRRRVLDLAADQHARLVPAHFGGVHSVFVERTADGFRPNYGG